MTIEVPAPGGSAMPLPSEVDLPSGGLGTGSVGVSKPPTEPNYTISEACQYINELEADRDRWVKEYTLLAETLDDVRESRERLRIRVMELEGEVDMLNADLRVAHGENDRLQGQLATAKAVGGAFR